MAEGLKLNEWYLYLDTSTPELVRFYLKRMFVRKPADTEKETDVFVTHD